jgi:adenylate cyclase
VPSEPDSPSSAFIERKLSTILSADVAEFSRLMSEDEEQTLRTFRGHKKVFEALVATHRGRVFNTAGDAILAEFSSAVEAVRCATDIQSALRTRNDKLEANRQVRFRIGINIGDVLIQGDDLLGDGVNVAARLQTAAEPGGICISGTVHDQIRNKLSLTFHSLGERTYKNIAQPVRTFSIADTEDGAPIPAVKPPAVAPKNFTKIGIAAGVAVALLVGGGYWAFTRNAAKTAEARASTAATTQPTASAQPKADSPAPNSPSAAPASAPTSDKPAAPPHKAAPTVAKPPVSRPAIPAATSTGGNAARGIAAFAGAYGGEICFDATEREPLRCFHAQGVVAGHKITGKWPVGRDTGITMFLDGDVNDLGEVKMELHTEKADGSRIITVDYKGAIIGDALDAEGKFRIGRGATLHWRKNLPADGAQP